LHSQAFPLASPPVTALHGPRDKLRGAIEPSVQDGSVAERASLAGEPDEDHLGDVFRPLIVAYQPPGG